MVVSNKLIFPIIFVIPEKQRTLSISTMVFTDNMFLTQLNLAGWWEVKERKLSPALLTVTFPLENVHHHQHSPLTKPSLPSPLPRRHTHHHHYLIHHHRLPAPTTISTIIIPAASTTTAPSSPWQPASSPSNHLHPFHNHCHHGQLHTSSSTQDSERNVALEIFFKCTKFSLPFLAFIYIQV